MSTEVWARAVTPGIPHYSYKKPFYIIAEGSKTASCPPLVGAVLTWMILGEAYYTWQTARMIGYIAV
jgi:hypothetical protein